MAVTDQIAGILNSSNLGRYREILSVFVRYGVGDIAENLANGTTSFSRTYPASVREALCELGPAFIKLGQLLSTRDELLSKSFRDELAKLQDQVTPFPFDVAAAVIEAELGSSIDSLFRKIEATPIASGSIGQVHRAWLLDGTEVVVKVQRPGIEDVLARDAAIIRQLFRRFGGNRKMGDSVGRLLSDFMDVIKAELDYVTEANNLDRFAWQLEHEAKIRIPRLIRSHSSRRVLTITYVAGTKLAEIGAYTPTAKNAAQIFAGTILKQIFAYGFFHGDPHAANVIVTPDESIGFYDFGLVGELGIRERENIATLLLGLVQQEPEVATEALVKLAGPSGAPDPRALRHDMSVFMVKYFRQPATEVPVCRLLDDILQMTAKHKLSLPRNFYLVFKVLATVESVGRRLDPSFDLITLSLPVLRRCKTSGPPQPIDAVKFFEVGMETFRGLHELPVALRSFLHQLNQGHLRLQFEHRGLEDAALCYDRAGIRLGSVLFIAIVALGGYGVIGCAIVARMITLRQATTAGIVLALFSGLLVLLCNRLIGYRSSSKSGRGR